jgi:hypothetical protein|tara:strand:+ start:337 stop:501 length:165 start_codon:yes stop_codon:yes gene_type:complete
MGACISLCSKSCAVFLWNESLGRPSINVCFKDLRGPQAAKPVVGDANDKKPLVL